jgi:hypothetical protein
MRLARSAAISIALLIGATHATAEEPKRVEIPLKEVYAFGMPGTRDLQELPAARANGKLVESIRKALKPELNHKEARRGFVVLGAGDDALRRAQQVLASGDEVNAKFPAGKELSAVFFAYQSPFYVHLDKVERKDFAIRIGYRFIPHQSGETTEHFALIPLGKLPLGNYSVRVEQRLMEKKFTDMGFTEPSMSAGQQLVCRTFHFVVASN